MESGWKAVLERQRLSGYAGFRGASVKGRLPVRESLVNEAIQSAQAGKRGAAWIERIEIRDNNLVNVSLGTTLWFLSRVSLELAIEPIIDFPRSPLLRIHISGLQGTIVELIQDKLRLPPNIAVIQSRTLTINLRAALETAGRADLVPLVQYLGITTEPGTLTLELGLAVP
ncbi:MAG: hypothetical protein H7Z41_12910 [Cytophagales bacterium]|nr:hypothetical protein [Armatimonadota bacterium]